VDWTAFALSLKLAAWTSVLIIPTGILAARFLAYRAQRARPVLEALVALPLVLPPTVLGYYLLVAFGAASPIGATWARLFGHPLAFSFGGLLAASLLVNVPFAVQPMQRAFEALPREVREAAWVSGLNPWRAFW
jgi:molybdate transport system permease protein